MRSQVPPAPHQRPPSPCHSSRLSQGRSWSSQTQGLRTGMAEEVCRVRAQGISLAWQALLVPRNGIFFRNEPLSLSFHPACVNCAFCRQRCCFWCFHETQGSVPPRQTPRLAPQWYSFRWALVLSEDLWAPTKSHLKNRDCSS